MSTDMDKADVQATMKAPAPRTVAPCRAALADTRARLEAAFTGAQDAVRNVRDLPPDTEVRKQRAVDLLALFANRAPMPPAEPFRTIRERRVHEELACVAAADLDELTDILAHLHNPTIMKLADAGFLRHQDGRRAAEAARRALESPGSVLNPTIVGMNRRNAEFWYRKNTDLWEDQYCRLYCGPTPPHRTRWEPAFEGRSRNDMVHAVAAIVVGAYEAMTDVSATRANADLPNPSGLGKLMGEVFKALDVSANPRAAIAASVATLSDRKVAGQKGISSKRPGR